MTTADCAPWPPPDLALVTGAHDEDDALGSSVVSRLDTILASFDGSTQTLSLSEISRRAGLPKTTVYRLAGQLCSVGWLERNGASYRIGLKLFEVGGIALQRNGLREAAFRQLYALAVKTGLSVHLAILDRDEVVYLDRVISHRFDPPNRVGGREAAYCTALGKAMLAFEDPAAAADVLKEMPRRTEFTITEPRAMHAALEGIRKTGIAYDREEAYRGLGCIASPIRNGGRAIGAISVSGPVTIMQVQSVVADVRNAALAVSSKPAARRHSAT